MTLTPNQETLLSLSFSALTRLAKFYHVRNVRERSILNVIDAIIEASKAELLTYVVETT